MDWRWAPNALTGILKREKAEGDLRKHRKEGHGKTKPEVEWCVPNPHRELRIKVVSKYRREELSAFSVFSGAPLQSSFWNSKFSLNVYLPCLVPMLSLSTWSPSTRWQKTVTRVVFCSVGKGECRLPFIDFFPNLRCFLKDLFFKNWGKSHRAQN